MGCLLIVTACSAQNQNTVGAFASNIFSTIINQDDQTQNIIMSPVSIQTCIAMTFFGAKGQTADEIVTGLHLGTSDKQKVAENFQNLLEFASNSSMINIANKMYVNQGYEVSEEFNDVAVKAFHSEAEILDFRNKVDSINTINNWVESKTNNKIQDLLSSNDMTDDVKIFLVNAIYFKGTWVNKFARTSRKDFWISETEKVEVDMMQKTASFLYGEFPDLNMRAIEMPYLNSKLSMMIILPNGLDGLKELEDQFLKNVNFLDLSKKMELENLTIKIPRFKIDFTISLIPILEKVDFN